MDDDLNFENLLLLGEGVVLGVIFGILSSHPPDLRITFWYLITFSVMNSYVCLTEISRYVFIHMNHQHFSSVIHILFVIRSIKCILNILN